MLRSILSIIAFFFPNPINVWLHRLAGASIGKYASIHFGVLLLVKNLEIKDNAKIKFGTMMNVRTFKLGRKSSIGFLTLVNGVDDFIVSDACVIGARSIINCDQTVTFEYYSGNGPGCYIYTHGSFLPVTEGYSATFAPVTIKRKVWVQMNCKIGPGVTIGEGSVIMPGTTLLENVEENKMVTGDPAKLLKVPILKRPIKNENLGAFANKIITEYYDWSRKYKKADWKLDDNILFIKYKRKVISVGLSTDCDIAIFIEAGKTKEGMYFNLSDLSTDRIRHPVKLELESYLRLYYGLIFLSQSEMS